MKAKSTSTRRLGNVQRYLALVSLVLFGHAVALHLLHGHAPDASVRLRPSAVALSTPGDSHPGSTRTGDDCPACQLQHGFAFLEAAPTIACLDVAAAIGSERSALVAPTLTARGTAPSRAPPAL